MKKVLRYLKLIVLVPASLVRLTLLAFLFTFKWLPPFGWLYDKALPIRMFGILASTNTGRGNCYTVIAGRLPHFAQPAGMVYELDIDGNPTKDFDKIVIL